MNYRNLDQQQLIEELEEVASRLVDAYLIEDWGSISGITSHLCHGLGLSGPRIPPRLPEVIVTTWGPDDQVPRSSETYDWEGAWLSHVRAYSEDPNLEVRVSVADLDFTLRVTG